MKGIFVNENGGICYAAAIVGGYKPIETRSRNMLRSCIGDRVAIVRTRRGKNPLVLGYANITSAEFKSAEWLDAHRNLTHIPRGSMYDATKRGKWCYQMERPEKCEPYALPADALRHGRSWCEFQID